MQLKYTTKYRNRKSKYRKETIKTFFNLVQFKIDKKVENLTLFIINKYIEKLISKKIVLL